MESLISLPVSALKVGVPERLEILCSPLFLLGLPQRMSVIMNLRLCNTSSEDIFDESTSRITPLLISRPTVNFINVLYTRFLYKILAPKITKPNVFREKLLNLLSYEKRAGKLLMKLTPFVNYTNILQATFLLICIKKLQSQIVTKEKILIKCWWNWDLWLIS